MSRKNNLKRRRQHHAAMLADERVRAATLKKKKERRQTYKDKKTADSELAGALDKLGTSGIISSVALNPVRKIGAPIYEEKADSKMGVARTNSGRIRKKRKKDLERSKKVKQRMLVRQSMVLDTA